MKGFSRPRCSSRTPERRKSSTNIFADFRWVSPRPVNFGDRIVSCYSWGNFSTARNPSSVVAYFPRPGFIGTDTFTYTAKDPSGGLSPATVRLTVEPSATVLGSREFAAGTDTGSGAATLFDADGKPRFTVAPFDAFTGGVRTATADFTGDGVAATWSSAQAPGGPRRSRFTTA